MTCLMLLFVYLPHPLASSFEQVRESIREKKSDLDQKKEKIESLSRREEEIYTSLEKIDKRVQATEKKLSAQEEKLSELRGREARLLEKYQKAKKAREEERARLNRLLSVLWPAYCNRMSHSPAQIREWSALDRRIYWLKNISKRVDEGLARLKAVQSELTSSLAELESVKVRVRKELDKTDELKDELLAQKLSYLSRVREIRAKRLVSENHVRDILDTIESLNYKLKALSEKDFSRMKGYLPWPCSGEIEKEYRPDLDPPQRGIGLSVTQGEKVKAVFWGKVVHNDKLRGFGKVVILFHGEDYYTLYAFLNSSRVELGQNVEKGEPIGTCGYYPDLKSEGLYFELRFHQKAINPMDWLSS
ncbi:MAG: murein hydrolase activator EnvC family protein [Desulfonatronovibrionaceae bacterium]